MDKKIFLLQKLKSYGAPLKLGGTAVTYNLSTTYDKLHPPLNEKLYAQNLQGYQ